MEDQDLLSKVVTNTVLSRRSFIKWNAALGGTAALAGGLKFGAQPSQKAAAATETKVVPATCPHNCGGRCLMRVHVEDGRMVRITTDDAAEDTFDVPRIIACPRGRSQRNRTYHADRLKYPMKRVGERGSGEFERISWDEALDTIASEMQRIKETYGNEAFYYVYASGAMGSLYGCYAEYPTFGGPLARLLNMYGGHLKFYGNYSAAQYYYCVPRMFGAIPGNSPKDLSNARLIVLWGDNPGETRMGGANDIWYLSQAKKAGAKIVVIDPRYSDTAAILADQWIPIRPGTDMALVAAIAYVLIDEDLYDQEFLDRYTQGFDKASMPEDYPPEACFKSYILGENDDVPKTPEWAEAITLIPANVIRHLAREMASVKPMSILQGFGIQRRAYGEQIVRGIPVLSAMTGNGGRPGSNMGTRTGGPGVRMGVYDTGTNPVSQTISFFTFTDAIFRGTEMGAADGVTGLPEGQDTLPSNIKFIWNHAGNALINQHSDTGRTDEILRDTSLAEFIVVSENFMTPSARYADILLPDVTHYERNDIVTANFGIGYAIYSAQAIEPMYECRNMLDICTELADRLGFKEEFTAGKTEEDWLREMVEAAQEAQPDFPDYETFKEQGIYKLPPAKEGSGIGLEAFYADPEENPLNTHSGKIQIFDPGMYDFGKLDEAPAVPQYVEEWESPWSPEAEKYPLQAFSHHYKRRSHSTFDNVPWLEEAAPQRVFINPHDAQARGIEDGDKVRIFNDRGQIVMPCRISSRIMPGVVDIPEGGWYTPDENGVDQRGCINTLTSQRPNPFSFGNGQHTNQVQVEKV